MGLINKIFGKKKAEPVIYNESFFRPGWFEGWEVLMPVLGELIAVGPDWKSILDFGCGPGVMIDYMNGRGYDYVGCDYSKEAHSLYLERYGKYPQRYFESLDECASKDFDLFIAFDVFEHLNDSEIKVLLKEVRRLPVLFLNISRAKSIAGHINIKSDRQWIKFLKGEGLAYNPEKTGEIRERYLALRPGAPDKWNENIFIFERPGV